MNVSEYLSSLPTEPLARFQAHIANYYTVAEHELNGAAAGILRGLKAGDPDAAAPAEELIRADAAEDLPHEGGRVTLYAPSDPDTGEPLTKRGMTHVLVNAREDLSAIGKLLKVHGPVDVEQLHVLTTQLMAEIRRITPSEEP